MSDPREELAALRRLAELEDKAAGKSAPSQDFMRGSVMENVGQYKIGQEGLPQSIKETVGDFSPLSQVAVGLKSGVDDMAMRLKQILGFTLSPEQIQEVKANRALLDSSGYAFGGNIGGQIAATSGPVGALQGALTQGAARVIPSALSALAPTIGAAGAGAAVAAATSPNIDEETTGQKAGMGAIGGAIGDTAVRGLSRLVQPIRQSAPVRMLLGEGVVPTPGQAAGANSFLGRMEQRLSSIPIIGDMVKGGRDRANTEFNLAAINRALPRTAQGQVTEAGRTAIRQVDHILSQGYDDVLSRIPTVRIDRNFGQRVNAAITDPDLALPPDVQQRLVNIVQTQIVDRAPNLVMSGDLAKRADSIFGTLARRYASSQDGDVRAMASGIRQVQSAFRDLISRNAAPADAAALRELNRSYANFVRVERASSYVKADSGVFDANQLSNAVRAMDPSLRKGAYARGNALMQDLSDAGRSTLSNTVPNSGTVDRALIAMALGAGGAGANEYMGGPSYLSALALSPFLFSRTGSRYMIGDLPGQQMITQGLRSLGPAAVVGGSNIATR